MKKRCGSSLYEPSPSGRDGRGCLEAFLDKIGEAKIPHIRTRWAYAVSAHPSNKLTAPADGNRCFADHRGVEDLVEASLAGEPRRDYPWLPRSGWHPCLAARAQTMAVEPSSGPEHAHCGLCAHLFLVGRCGELLAVSRTSSLCALVDAGFSRRNVPTVAAVLPALVLAADNRGDASLRVVRRTAPPSKLLG